jgi:hypothetical protein
MTESKVSSVIEVKVSRDADFQECARASHWACLHRKPRALQLLQLEMPRHPLLCGVMRGHAQLCLANPRLRQRRTNPS